MAARGDGGARAWTAETVCLGGGGGVGGTSVAAACAGGGWRRRAADDDGSIILVGLWRQRRACVDGGYGMPRRR